ncbi:MAG TPA: hypothetical protein PKO23_18390 [Candidatus Hydrogenedentes bacterium]|nr:hypothetical protein [Candidatus Hydrogenedentota bacterium]
MTVNSTHNTYSRFLVALVCLTAVSLARMPGAHAAVGPFVKNGVKEIFRLVGHTGGKQGGVELSRYLGRQGVEEIVERALREGGEEAASRVIQIGGQYGARGLRAVKSSPAVLSRALSELPVESLRPALNIINRQPRLMGDIVQRYGARGIQAELTHPGVGASLVNRFGENALKLSKRLDTNQMIGFARHATAIETLPPGPRTGLLEILYKTPGHVLDALESHPNVLAACKALGITGIVAAAGSSVGHTVFAGTSETVSPDGQTEKTEGILPIAMTSFSQPIGTGVLVLFVVVALCLGFVIVVRFALPGIAAYKRVKNEEKHEEESKAGPRIGEAGVNSP